MRIPKKILIFTAIALVVLFLSGCAAHSNLEPIGKGELNGNIGIGGPIIKAFDLNFPLPYATAGVDYGISDNINLNGGVHLLPMVYGIIGVDFGMTWFPFHCDCKYQPTIGIQPRIMTLTSVKADVDERFKLYPILSLTAAWQLGSGLIYFGWDTVIPLTSPDYDNEATQAIISPFLGYRWQLSRKTRLITEFKWQGANVNNKQVAVEYTGMGGYGGITPLISIERDF